ncbi:MAG: 50S ribosomal protein L17 [Chloroflexota bacterium]|nr:50S ribosomal protein L17 [Chloroflexota bacterium]
MRHRVSGRTFSRPTDHRLAMYRNLMKDLVEHEAICTTEPKAKEVRGMIERLITLGKKQSLQARREAIKLVNNTNTVKKVFDELGPRYSDREGGYTRIVKMGQRRGDGAPIARIELLE